MKLNKMRVLFIGAVKFSQITLEELINNRETILSKGSEGKIWVENYHNINKVGDKLYTYYKSIGLTNRQI